MVRIPKKMGLLSPKTETKSPETETKVLLLGQRAATKKQPCTRAKQGMSTTQLCVYALCAQTRNSNSRYMLGQRHLRGLVWSSTLRESGCEGAEIPARFGS